MTTAKELGARLAQERREKAAKERQDITQRVVADAIGTSGANVSRWEKGQAVPGDDFLAKLADYFGVRRAWLRYGEGERDGTATADAKLADPKPHPRRRVPRTG